MNIFEKLQKCRVELQKTNLKKSGKNTFSKYDYFELSDFLPRINELMLENKLTGIFSYTDESASLTIYDTEKLEDFIVFSTPIEKAQLKGCHGIQNIGATQTYARRYLYIMAFEIAEHDAIDTAPPEEPPKEPEQEKFDDKMIDELKLKSLEERMKTAEVDEAVILEQYQLDSLKEMTTSIFMTVMNRLEKTIQKNEKLKAKQPKIENLDLGI